MAIKMEENQEYWNPLLDNRKKEKLPVRWTSPEAATDHHFSYASDMWAAGVTMFEICSCGQRPYKDQGFTDRPNIISLLTVRFLIRVVRSVEP